MEDPNSTLLPYILETLSRKPELCDTLDNLCHEIQDQLIQEQNSKYGNVKTSIQRALGVGQSLGIITLTNETIRVPFSFRQGKNSKAPTMCACSPHQLEIQQSGKSEKSQDKNAQQQQQQQQPQQQQQQTQQQQQQPQQRNQKSTKQGSPKVRYDESEYSIIPPAKLRKTLSRGRSKSAPRKVRHSFPRAKATSRGRRGRWGRRTARGRR